MVSTTKIDNASHAGQIVSRSPRQIAWMRFKRNKVGMVAAAISVTVILLSIFAPLVCKVLGINPDDLNLIKVVDTEDEVLEALDNFYKKYNLSPNF